MNAEPERARFAPLPEWTQPLVWTPNGKRPFYRFVAHLLIRLLVLLPMPPECQAWAFAFPASLFWSWSPRASAPAPPPQQAPGEAELPEAARPANAAVLPLSESQRWTSLGAADPTGFERILNLTNPAQPQIAGVLNGIGGRLGIDENGLLFGTARSVFGGETALGGVSVAALGGLNYFAVLPADQPCALPSGGGQERGSDPDGRRPCALELRGRDRRGRSLQGRHRS